MGARHFFAFLGLAALVGAGPAWPQEEPPATGREPAGETFSLLPHEPFPAEGPPADRPPISILIGPYLPKGSIELPALAPEPASGAPEEGAAAAAGAGGEDIAVDTLAALDPSAIGAWSDARIPALPVTMWDGTPRQVLTTLLPRLPVATGSPTARQLARRLLLSPARIEYAEGDAGTSPLVLRLEALARGGAIDDLLALVERVPPAAMSEEIERLKANALLLRGDYAAACTIAGKAVARSGAAYWLKLLAMCEALNGNRAGTDFRLSLLADADENDPVLARLVEALLVEIEGGSAAAGSALLADARRLDPLLFALARLTRTPIPPDLARAAPPMLLGSILEMPDNSPALRLELSERALRAGLLDGGGLAPILAAIPFSDEARALPLEASRGEVGPDSEPADAADADPAPAQAGTAKQAVPVPEGLERIALLFQTAVAATDPAGRLRAIDLALGEAAELGLRLPVAQALAVPLSGLRPGPALADRADLAGRIALAADRLQDARAWYDAARTAAAAGDGKASAALARLWPLLVVGDETGTVPYGDRLLELWWQGRGELSEQERLRRGDLFFALLEALGYAVPDSLRREVLGAAMQPAANPGINLWRELILAIRERRTGAVVLDALIGLGPAAAEDANPSFLVAAVAGLESVGLARDARRLALEALIAAGF